MNIANSVLRFPLKSFLRYRPSRWLLCGPWDQAGCPAGSIPADGRKTPLDRRHEVCLHSALGGSGGAGSDVEADDLWKLPDRGGSFDARPHAHADLDPAEIFGGAYVGFLKGKTALYVANKDARKRRYKGYHFGRAVITSR